MGRESFMDKFESLGQGSQAREQQIARARAHTTPQVTEPLPSSSGESLLAKVAKSRLGHAAAVVLGLTTVVAASEVACAPSKPPEVRPVETAVPTPTIKTAKVIFPIASKGEGTPPPPTPTSKPPETATATAPASTPTEAPKPADIPEIKNKFNALSGFLNELSSPLNPKLSQEEFESKKRSVQSEIQAIQNDLENNDLEAARKKIYRTGEVGQTTTVYGLFGSIINLGDPLQEKLVSQDIKQKHDPKDKYIKRSRVDPRILDYWLSIIDILRNTDLSY